MGRFFFRTKVTMMKTTIQKIRGNEKGLALIWTYLTSVSLLALLVGFYSFSSADTKTLANDSANLQAFYLAEAGIDQKIVELRRNPSNTSSIVATLCDTVVTANFDGGNGPNDPCTSGTSVPISVLYNNSTGIATSTATVGGVTRKIYTKISNTSQSIPPGVYGAVTALHGMTLITDGYDMKIDGGENAPGIATYDGNVTTVKYSPAGDALVAGMGSSLSDPPNPLALSTIETNTNLTSTNAVLGLPQDSNSLSAYALTSYGSSQITGTNQVWNITASSPTGASGLILGSPGAPSSGILIIKNAPGVNVVIINGDFNGLIIVDCPQVMSQHLTLNGAFVNIYQGASSFYMWNSPYEVKIKYDPSVLTSLPHIDGASYLNPSTSQVGWSDGNKDGPNPLIYYSPQDPTLVGQAEDGTISVQP